MHNVSIYVESNVPSQFQIDLDWNSRFLRIKYGLLRIFDFSKNCCFAGSQPEGAGGGQCPSKRSRLPPKENFHMLRDGREGSNFSFYPPKFGLAPLPTVCSGYGPAVLKAGFSFQSFELTRNTIRKEKVSMIIEHTKMVFYLEPTSITCNLYSR